MHDELLKPRYSGTASTSFWKQIAAIEDPEGQLIYIAACALQDHEERFFQMLRALQKDASNEPT